MTERLHRRDHIIMLGNMVGAKNIDDQIESALQLLDVIRDVGRAIDRVSVVAGAHQHAIFRKSERLGPQP